MNKLSCLIVDDEPIARQVIERYAGQYAVLDVVASCENALEAKSALQLYDIDLIFLDINMPLLDGISFFKTLKKSPQVIFSTAYKEHALEAFDLAACDYLLKPYSFERFIIAVDKAVERSNLLCQIDSKETDMQIFLKSEGRIHNVFYDDILFAEANGNLTKIATLKQQITPTITFNAFEELLPKNRFIRVHRSFIINKDKITHIEGNRIFIDKSEIPIGSNYRDNFIRICGLRDIKNFR